MTLEAILPFWSGLQPLIEPLAVATGIACVGLVVRQSIWNWPVGIVSVVLFAILFVQAGLYADAGLQIVYVALGLYGWWHWLHGGPVRDDLPVTRASIRMRISLVVLAIIATLALGSFVDRTTDSTVPFPDAATTVLSLTAQFLLTRKHIENWPVWIFGVNIPYIAIYTYKGLLLTAALQFVFIALSILGWIAWRRSMASRETAMPERHSVASEVMP